MKHPNQLSDPELVTAFRELAIDQKQLLALELQYIAELDRRRLFFEYPSLRGYLVAEHGYEDWDAEKKIRTARLYARFPIILDRIKSGSLNVTLIELALGCAAREKMSDDELSALLDAISGLSVKQAMREIATLYPGSFELPRDKIRPISASHSQVTFAASDELLSKLEDIKGLLAHSHPGITMAQMIDILATEYRERHHPEAKARRADARKETKSVESPTAQRKEPPSVPGRKPTQEQVHSLTLRDGYRCSYVNPANQSRCTVTRALEIDHIVPYSDGGTTELENLRYLCKGHHQRVTFVRFGRVRP